MTDKELLELAAKAAGYGELIFRNGADDDGYDDGVWTYTWRRDEQQKLVSWNPLSDDGDALRLAVKLGMCVTVFARLDPPDVWAGYKDHNGIGQNAIEPIGDDPYAATRRAIVRAAAEIGKGMK